jgi:hypothetical protein
MKTFKTFAVAIAVMVLAVPALAQSKNAFKASLLSPIVRTGSFFYERAMSEDTSLQLGFFYTGMSFGDTYFRGIGLTPEFRFYLSSSPAPNGIFVAPYARYQNFSLSNDHVFEGKATYTSIGGGLLVGAQTLLKNVITLEGFIGPSYSSGKIKITSGDEDDFNTGIFDGFGVRFGLTIGVAF